MISDCEYIYFKLKNDCFLESIHIKNENGLIWIEFL